MILRPSKVEYQFEAHGGYGFRVVAEWDAERPGWRATVEMVTGGSATPEDAVRHLRHSAEAFLLHLKSEEQQT